MGFSRQEYWSELPCPFPRDLPDPRTRVSYVSCVGSRFFTTSTTWEAPQIVYLLANKLSKTELLNSEENIGFQTTFSLDILEDPNLLGVQIAWLQKKQESWTHLPGTSDIARDINILARHQGQQETCWEGGLSYLLLSLLQKRKQVSCRHSSWSLSKTLEEKLLLLVHWLLQQWDQENGHFHELDGSDGKESTCNAGDLGSVSGLGRCPGGGDGNPLQYSCLEHPHGQRNLVGYGPWSRKGSDMTERVSIAQLGKTVWQPLCDCTSVSSASLQKSRKLTHSLPLETACF